MSFKSGLTATFRPCDGLQTAEDLDAMTIPCPRSDISLTKMTVSCNSSDEGDLPRRSKAHLLTPSTG